MNPMNRCICRQLRGKMYVNIIRTSLPLASLASFEEIGLQHKISPHQARLAV